MSVPTLYQSHKKLSKVQSVLTFFLTTTTTQFRPFYHNRLPSQGEKHKHQFTPPNKLAIGNHLMDLILSKSFCVDDVHFFAIWHQSLNTNVFCLRIIWLEALISLIKYLLKSLMCFSHLGSSMGTPVDELSWPNHLPRATFAWDTH
jgi:hypothetical protein